MQECHGRSSFGLNGFSSMMVKEAFDVRELYDPGASSP